MKRQHITLLVLGFILLTAVITNPDQERHKEVLRSKINSYFQKAMTEEMTDPNDEWAQAGQALGMMIGGTIVERIVDNLISTDNYIFFSTTKITWNGQTRVIGFGVFGNVFLTKKLDDAVKDGLLESQ